MKVCIVCGKEIGNQDVCTGCGADLSSVPDIEAVDVASKTLAAVVTRFYRSLNGVPNELKEQLVLAYFNFLLKGTSDATSGVVGTAGKDL